MKRYDKSKQPALALLILLFSIIIAACLLTPLLKLGIDVAVQKSPWMAGHLDFEEGQYNVARVFRRALLPTAVILLFAFRRRLEIGTLAEMGLRGNPRWRLHFAQGVALGTISLVICLGVLLLSGAAEKAFINPAWDIVTDVVLAMGVAICVSVPGEIIFRGFMLQCFMKGLPVWVAVAISSTIYSLLHFLKGSFNVELGWMPWVGFEVFGEFLKPFLDIGGVLPGFVGLLLTGVVLSVAYLRTRSLHLSIGLHAGWVFVLKAYGSFVYKFRHHQDEWFFGGREIVTGVLGWLLLLCLLAVVLLVTRQKKVETKVLPCTES